MTALDHRRRHQETSCIDGGIHTWAFEEPAAATENVRIGANGGAKEPGIQWSPQICNVVF